MTGFPSTLVALVVGIPCFVILAGILFESARKQIKRERARCRWVESIKQPKDVEPV